MEVLPQPHLGGGNHSQTRPSRAWRSREGQNDDLFNAGSPIGRTANQSSREGLAGMLTK